MLFPRRKVRPSRYQRSMSTFAGKNLPPRANSESLPASHSFYNRRRDVSRSKAKNEEHCIRRSRQWIEWITRQNENVLSHQCQSTNECPTSRAPKKKLFLRSRFKASLTFQLSPSLISRNGTRASQRRAAVSRKWYPFVPFSHSISLFVTKNSEAKLYATHVSLFHSCVRMKYSLVVSPMQIVFATPSCNGSWEIFNAPEIRSDVHSLSARRPRSGEKPLARSQNLAQ